MGFLQFHGFSKTLIEPVAYAGYVGPPMRTTQGGSSLWPTDNQDDSLLPCAADRQSSVKTQTWNVVVWQPANQGGMRMKADKTKFNIVFVEYPRGGRGETWQAGPASTTTISSGSLSLSGERLRSNRQSYAPCTDCLCSESFT